jgi:exosome complex component CSL4
MLVVPGQRLGLASEFNAGPKTHVLDGIIYSTVLGIRTIQNQTISVNVKKESNTPDIGSKVIARVTRVNPQYASVDILIVDDHPCDFLGLIRVQDVREKGLPEIYKSFRPGDIVSAKVLALGEKRAFYLTTAGNEYGVILAQSLAGNRVFI